MRMRSGWLSKQFNGGDGSSVRKNSRTSSPKDEGSKYDPSSAHILLRGRNRKKEKEKQRNKAMKGLNDNNNNNI